MTDFAQVLQTQLDPAQLAVAHTLRGPLCVLAGAGAGKTRALTYRIANAVHRKIVTPQNILALTFTTRAAGEMRSRLRQIGVTGVQVKTFHAAALAQLNYFWPTAIGGRVPELKENTLALVSQAAARLNLPTDTPTIRDLRDAIAWAKVQLITPDTYPSRALAAGRDEIAAQKSAAIARLMIAYEELKTERGVIDFEDVILILIGLLVDRPDIAKQIRAQYTYFVVDEFQDVSPMQHRLLQLWLGQNKDLCVVGDVSQTIYSFAGANSEYLANFAAYWSGAKQIVLNRDYRSTPQIVELANKTIGKSTTALAQSHSQPQPPNRNSAAAGAVFLVSARAAGRPVSFQDYQDDNAQAEGIAHKISELHKKGTPLKDIAILYRTNTQSAVFETALNAAGISYTIKGGKRFFERPEVINAMVSLRAGARVNPAADVTECLNDVLWQMGWRKEAPASPGASRERWESLDVLRQMSEKFRAESALERKNDSTTANTSVQAFIDYLAEHAKFEMEPQLASVTLSSLHSAKGLEWPIVFLAGVNEGLLPISYAKSPSEIEEERRLFYVGITRAADELYLSYSKANLNGKKRKASQFLAPLWPREVSSATQKRITAKVDHHKFVSEHPADLALYEELRQWRAQLAKTAEKPPYTIFPDTVLRRIAINKPRSLDELRLIKGIGSLKLSRYGLALLTLVNDFLDQKSS